MKLFLLRTILFILFFMLFQYVLHHGAALLEAFIAEYLTEPLITQLI